MNSSGLRDTTRNIGVSKTAVISELKKTPLQVNSSFMLNAAAESPLDPEIQLSTEGDEFQSFVGSKADQRCTWYVIERETGAVPAFHNVEKTDESCACLMEKPSDFPIKCFHTDNRQRCRKFIPAEKHIIGKDSTWKIERRNLNFRSHIKRLSRKAICFSKNEDIHDNVIGMYSNRFYFDNGNFLESS